MAEKIVVAPHGDAWEVKDEKAARFTSLHKSKDSAVAAANSEAKKKQTTVLVKGVRKPR